mmetsp:Transcript_4614/g.7831  ORF Transcript_4614/g.7831 Transcript_4614/m.7831 type:complete len:234 (+) Transcript_4614:261-962(+)
MAPSFVGSSSGEIVYLVCTVYCFGLLFASLNLISDFQYQTHGARISEVATGENRQLSATRAAASGENALPSVEESANPGRRLLNDRSPHHHAITIPSTSPPHLAGHRGHHIRGREDTHFRSHDHTDLHTVRLARDRDWAAAKSARAGAIDRGQTIPEANFVANTHNTVLGKMQVKYSEAIKYEPAGKHAFPQKEYASKIEYCCTHAGYTQYCANAPAYECPKQFLHSNHNEKV